MFSFEVFICGLIIKCNVRYGREIKQTDCSFIRQNITLLILTDVGAPGCPGMHVAKPHVSLHGPRPQLFKPATRILYKTPGSSARLVICSPFELLLAGKVVAEAVPVAPAAVFLGTLFDHDG